MKITINKMKTKLFLLMGIVGVLIACQHKPAAEEGISQSVYMDKLDRSLEARVFQNDETLMHPDSLPDDWERQVRRADWSSESWFNKYYLSEDTVFSEAEMAEIFKAVFENDTVLNMEVRGWDKLRDILPRYDITFFNLSEKKTNSIVLESGLILNFNNHPTPKRGLNLRVYKLPNSILWLEFHYHYPPEYRERFDSRITVAVQIKGNTIIPLCTKHIET